MIRSITLATLLVGIINQSAISQITRAFAEPFEKRLVAAIQPDVVALLKVKEGSQVKAGDVLAELDNQVLKQSLRIAELRSESNSAIAAAEASLKIRKRKLDKLVPLLQRGHANQAEIEVAQSEFEAAAAELSLAREKKRESQIEVQKISAEIERRIIRSPIDGVVTQIHCKPGEYIASSERQLATVVNLDKLRIRFYLLAASAAKLRVSEKVDILYGQDKRRIIATIEYVSAVTDPDSGTTRVDVLIDNSRRRLRSGTFCEWVSSDETEGANLLSEAGQ